MGKSKITYRNPIIEDGSEIYELIKSCPPLDVNSQYFYHIICHDFKKSCVIAEINQQVVGFVSGYIKPEDPCCLFVWQVAVSKKARGSNLATNMLTWLTKQPKCYNINSLEATVSPSNQASQKLFKRFAKSNNAICRTLPFLNASHFGVNDHEEEILFKISSLKISTI